MLIVFPRSRWTRLDEAIDWVGIFASVHSLLPIVYGIWYETVTGRKQPTRPASSTLDAPSDFSVILDGDVVGAPGVGAPGGGGPAADAGGDAAEPDHEPSGDDPTHGANDSPEKT